MADKQWLFAQWMRVFDNARRYNGIVQRYEEPHRFYHTLGHIEFGLKLIEQLDFKQPIKDVMAMAFWYHDAVYDTEHRAESNESLSAKLAAKHRLYPVVGELILATTPGLWLANKSDTEKAFISVDLAILGQDEQTYHRYAQNIRKEYIQYLDQQYVAGRKAVLEKFLIKARNKSLFPYQPFSTKYSDLAYRNIMQEIDSLNKIA
jgi:predicted metal-dependent HD superfamily phosphohydrolase